VRRAIVGVMGSGVDRHEDLAAPLGRWIAEHGHHLLTGGGAGVMEAVSEAFARVPGRVGLAIGVLKAMLDAQGRVVPRTPNPFVDIAIRTHLPLSGDEGTAPLSRNHINVLSADLVVGLPGGGGTRSEMELALRYERPVVAFLGGMPRPADWPPLPVVATLEELARLATPVLARAAAGSPAARTMG
jgi:uncharacterized protein (TIGR00725 family)